MVKKVCLALVACAVLIPGLRAQTVDEVIAKNIQARGGMDKLKSVKSIKTTATLAMGPGMEAPGVMIQKRPDMARLEFTIQGLTAVQAYDGSKAWQVMPFMGKKDAELMSADDAKEMQETADLDGPLVDYKAKGNTVELLGKEKIEGTDAYKLKVSLKMAMCRPNISTPIPSSRLRRTPLARCVGPSTNSNLPLETTRKSMASFSRSRSRAAPGEATRSKRSRSQRSS